MKKRNLISIVLIVVGLGLECVHFLGNLTVLNLDLSIVGGILITIGIFRMVWTAFIPLLEKRAEVLGKFKKKRLRDNN